MATHVFIAAGTEASVVGTLEVTFRADGFVPTSTPTSKLPPTVQIAELPDGVELRLRGVPRAAVRRLALALAESGAVVRLAECEIPLGSRGEQLSASGLRIDGGELEELDLDADAAEILHEWSDGQPVYEEGVTSELLAAALLDRNPDAFRATTTLVFEPELGGRVGDLARKIRAGASFEWTTIGDKPALKLDAGEGGRQIAVLTDDEKRVVAGVIAELGD